MGVLTILTNDKGYFFSSPCHLHAEEAPQLPPFFDANFLDVTKLFTGLIGDSVKCTTKTAARTHLYVIIEGDYIPVQIQVFGDLLGLYYDTYENESIARILVPIKEIEDKIYKKGETIKITNEGTVSPDAPLDTDALVEQMKALDKETLEAAQTYVDELFIPENLDAVLSEIGFIKSAPEELPEITEEDLNKVLTVTDEGSAWVAPISVEATAESEVGVKIGTVTINGVDTDFYAPANNIPEGGTEGQVLVLTADGELTWANQYDDTQIKEDIAKCITEDDLADYVTNDDLSGFLTADDIKDFIKAEDLKKIGDTSLVKTEEDDEDITITPGSGLSADDLVTINNTSLIKTDEVTNIDIPTYNDTEVRGLIAGKADTEHTHDLYLTEDDLTGYAKGTIPTKVSDLTNDSNFITSNDVPEAITLDDTKKSIDIPNVGTIYLALTDGKLSLNFSPASLEENPEEPSPAYYTLSVPPSETDLELYENTSFAGATLSNLEKGELTIDAGVGALPVIFTLEDKAPVIKLYESGLDQWTNDITLTKDTWYPTHTIDGNTYYVWHYLNCVAAGVTKIQITI